MRWGNPASSLTGDVGFDCSMKDPVSLLIRIACGERLEKATPEQRRGGAVVLLIVPSMFVTLLLCEKYNIAFLHSPSSLTLWLGAVAVLSALCFAGLYWARHVSPKLTIILAVVAWTVLLWMLFGLGYWDVRRLQPNHPTSGNSAVTSPVHAGSLGARHA